MAVGGLQFSAAVKGCPLACVTVRFPGAVKALPIVRVVCPVAPVPSDTVTVTVWPAGATGVKTPDELMVSPVVAPLRPHVNGELPPSLRVAVSAIGVPTVVVPFAGEIT